MFYRPKWRLNGKYSLRQYKLRRYRDRRTGALNFEKKKPSSKLGDTLFFNFGKSHIYRSVRRSIVRDIIVQSNTSIWTVSNVRRTCKLSPVSDVFVRPDKRSEFFGRRTHASEQQTCYAVVFENCKSNSERFRNVIDRNHRTFNE